MTEFAKIFISNGKHILFYLDENDSFDTVVMARFITSDGLLCAVILETQGLPAIEYIQSLTQRNADNFHDAYCVKSSLMIGLVF